MRIWAPLEGWADIRCMSVTPISLLLFDDEKQTDLFSLMRGERPITPT